MKEAARWYGLTAKAIGSPPWVVQFIYARKYAENADNWVLCNSDFDYRDPRFCGNWMRIDIQVVAYTTV